MTGHLESGGFNSGRLDGWNLDTWTLGLDLGELWMTGRLISGPLEPAIFLHYSDIYFFSSYYLHNLNLLQMIL